MRVWVDLTNSPHVLVMRPLIAAMREEGHQVEVTARDFALSDFEPDTAADLVISAGGTMNREAVALGTPVYTTFEGRLGAVDEALLREGRLRRLSDPAEIVIERRPRTDGLRTRRDPRELVKLLLSAAA